MCVGVCVWCACTGLDRRVLQGTLKVDEYVTGTFPLDRINDAFHDLHEGRAVRSIIALGSSMK